MIAQETYLEVARLAAETHGKIKTLRKTMPSSRAYQRVELEAAVQAEKDAWWDSVKKFMTRPSPGTPP